MTNPLALDPELAQEVVTVLRQLAREGTTMLIATHDLRLAAQIAQQVIFLEAGEVVECRQRTPDVHHPQAGAYLRVHLHPHRAVAGELEHLVAPQRRLMGEK